MNRQIRRLGSASSSVPRAVRAAQLHPGRATPTSSTTDPRQHAARRPRLQPATRRDPVTADGAVLARSVRPNDQFKLPARVPRGRPVRPRHRLLLVHLRQRRASSGPTTTSSPAHRQLRSSAASATCSSTRTTPANVTLTLARSCSRSPRTRSATARARSSRSTRRTGAILALWSFPSLRPQPARRPRPATPCSATCDAARTRPGQAAARPQLPGALLPRLDVQGRDRRRPR